MSWCKTETRLVGTYSYTDSPFTKSCGKLPYRRNLSCAFVIFVLRIEVRFYMDFISDMLIVYQLYLLPLRPKNIAWRLPHQAITRGL